jgi:hypothetical protein
MKTKKNEYFPITSLRETLRQRANALTAQLSRSVNRLTSCDLLPCMEYGEEVAFQQSLAQELFYIQSCRNALERCIGNGGAMLRYRWSDGTICCTRFRRTGPGQVKVSGLRLPASAAAGVESAGLPRVAG